MYQETLGVSWGDSFLFCNTLVLHSDTFIHFFSQHPWKVEVKFHPKITEANKIRSYFLFACRDRTEIDS